MRLPNLVNSLAQTLLLGLLFAVTAQAELPRVPASDMLLHGQYRIGGEMAWHRTRDDEGHGDRFPLASNVQVGLFDRTMVGLGFGEEISLVASMRLVDEDPWIPAVTLGARNLFGSQEAHLASVPDSLRRDHEGEVFIGLAKQISRTRLVLGASVFQGLDSGRAQPFWGVHQPLGQSFAVQYDGFRRHKALQHNLGLAWNVKEVLVVSAGATSVDRFFEQKGVSGFYIQSADRDAAWAYGVPGAYLRIELVGLMKQSGVPNAQARILENEKRLEMQVRREEDLRKRLDRLELQVTELRAGTPDSIGLRESRADTLLVEIVRGMQSDAWVPSLLRAQQDSLLALGEPAWRMLIRTALGETSAPLYRETALRIMGTSRNPRFVPALSQALMIEDSGLQREALMALGKIGTPEAGDAIRLWQGRAPENLRPLTAEILRTIK